MLLVAFAPPLWAATLRTLRGLTRPAVTALVLVVGLGGPAAAPASAEAVRPTAEPGRIAAFQVPPAPITDSAAAGSATAGRSAGSTVEWVAAPSGASAVERVTGTPSERPAGAVSARPARCAPAPSPASAAGPARADPGRDAVGRRGPPRD
ncbi:hypothetical protein [Micromonospora kangleipakensis]|uniref:hypothetical protein n=1 Tax=Micromonospora kangleipakensis TaxID=1077942 RepID=UPI00102A84D0|nr:hypothetical protein [Micromonospora kangleipakensis]